MPIPYHLIRSSCILNATTSHQRDSCLFPACRSGIKRFTTLYLHSRLKITCYCQAIPMRYRKLRATTLLPNQHCYSQGFFHLRFLSPSLFASYVARPTIKCSIVSWRSFPYYPGVPLLIVANRLSCFDPSMHAGGAILTSFR